MLTQSLKTGPANGATHENSTQGKINVNTLLIFKA